MSYSIKEAKELIVKGGLEFCEKKLIARTWGNISARISDTEFIITPSGIPYDKVTKKDLVTIKIEDCSWSGDVKPSSEKKLHAAIYKARPDVNFILHTHQTYATAISVDGKDKDFVSVAKYGLPSTKTLVKNVVKKVLEYPNQNATLLERHGAVIYGKDYDDAFNIAIDLENKAKELYESSAIEKDSNIEAKPYLDDYAQMYGYSSLPIEADEEAAKLVKTKNIYAARYQKKVKPMNCFDVLLQHYIYKKKYSKIAKK